VLFGVCVCEKVGVYFPVDVGHVDHYGSLSVKLMSVDLVSHSDIVIRDFFLSLNKKQVSNKTLASSAQNAHCHCSDSTEL